MSVRDCRTFVLAGLMIVLVGCGAPSEKSDKITHDLLALERDFLNKEFALDTAGLAYLMDSTFIDITDFGIKGKKEDLVDIYNNIDQRIKNGIVLDSFRLENDVVNVYWNSAVVTFIVHSFRHSNDTLIERKTRFYDVWTKRGDSWKLVASQGTIVQNND
ncbi:MAG: nuclear transport factor 2 family protein [Chryseolinea sp.]